MDEVEAGREPAGLDWRGRVGRNWLEAEYILDEMLRPLGELLVARVAPSGAQSVLDVGCGTGDTTRLLARNLDEAGRAVGVDISADMIAAARSAPCSSGGKAEFICADAQTYPFEAAEFDVVCSRFGVMFFDDPVAALRNLAAATKPGGRFVAVVWRTAEDNPFMTTAERAAEALLPGLEVRTGDAAGQFGFADRRKVRAYFDTSGWSDIAFEAVDVSCNFEARDLADYVGRMGPVGRALIDAPAALRDRVIEAALPAFEPFEDGDRIRFDAACWVITRRRVDASTPGVRHGDWTPPETSSGPRSEMIHFS